MRGNVCIELHNHKTGLRDRIEGHNDVTDALQTMINAYVFRGLGLSEFTPIVKNLLGGIILMDKQLSGTDIFIPGNTNVVGSGFQGSNTESKIVGTYNEAESGIDDTQRIYTHVWDFATSQANGTINSLGLTTNIGGQYPNSPTSFFNPQAEDGNIIYVDETSNDVYYVKGNAIDEIIYKYHYNFTDFMLHCENKTFRGTDTGKTIDASNLGYSIDGHDGFIYIPWSDYSSRVNGKIYFNVYKVSDLSFEKQSDLTISFSSHGVPSIELGEISHTINGAMGYVYTYTSVYSESEDKYYYYIYRYDTGNDYVTVYDISMFGNANGNNPLTILPMSGGDIYCLYNTQENSNVGFRISVDGIISKYIEIPDYSRIFGGAPYTLSNGIIIDGSGSGVLSNMLMTNFNLPTPIEKTSTQSMKVIYTLTQE